MTKITLAAGAAAFAVVFIVHGGVNGYAVWNALPIPVALLPLLVGKSERGIKYGVYGFSLTIVLLVLGVHTAHIADPGVTGAADARFIKLPFLSIGAGYVAAMSAALCGVILEARQERRGEKLEDGGIRER